MVIGILVFNKLVSKDGITDVKLKERAGASLWSSCVILPLLALTWMSAVLAMTDRRSALFQILFAVFDSLEGFIIVMVHCILRREVSAMFLSRKLFSYVFVCIEGCFRMLLTIWSFRHYFNRYKMQWNAELLTVRTMAMEILAVPSKIATTPSSWWVSLVMLMSWMKSLWMIESCVFNVNVLNKY